MTNALTFITGNAGKAAQLSKYLGLSVNHHKLDLVEVQSVELTEVVEHKVKEAYSILEKPVVVDDVSLSIHALGKLPGPFIKFFIAELGNDGICKLIHGDRAATATVAIGYHDGGDVKIFLGEIQGTISESARGEGGFGWDAIFIPDGYTQTRAEMNESDYDKTSPRKQALEKLEKFLSSKKQ